MNKVTLIGRTTKDIELRKSTNGKSVCQFTIAVNKNFGQDGADFINCVAWNNNAEFLSKYVKKGYLVSVVGRLSVRTYESNGKTNYVTEVICDEVENLTPKQVTSKSPASYQQVNALDAEPLTYNEVKLETDELPFY